MDGDIIMHEINFKAIAQEALSYGRSLVESWIPSGSMHGYEYVARNPTRSDENPGSFKINLRTGEWSDFAVGDSGGDLISLYAYLNFCDQKESANQISEILRISPPTQKQSFDRKQPDVGSLTQVFPVPADAPAPPDSFPKNVNGEWVRYKLQHKWEYRDRLGDLLGYVVRYETPEGKETPPLTLWKNPKGEYKWKFKAFPDPRPLYNLHRICHDTSAQIVIVEGEKCAELLQTVFDGVNAPIVVVAWQGGCKAVDKADWSPLQNKRIVLWPDSDEPGRKAMLQISATLQSSGCKVKIIQVPDDKPGGWDSGDAILKDRWSFEQIATFMKSTLSDAPEITPQPSDEAPPPPNEEYHASEPAQSFAEPDTFPFRSLGYNGDFFYYLPNGTRQVKAIKGEAHGSGTLLTLAPLQYWERNYPGQNGPAWKYAANTLLRLGEKVGVYDSMRLRGRGAWYDKGRSVLHLGDFLVVDNDKMGINEIDSRFIYEAGAKLEYQTSEPLTNQQAYRLQEIIGMLFWEKPIYAKLLAGWCVIAPVCGGLRHRPHVWVTAKPGSGKSYIIEHIIKPCLGDFVLSVQSKTSEAGVRQRLGNDALAVIIDEFEGEDYISRQNVQKVLDLARQAFSDSDARILKGGQTGHSTSYQIRSSFFMSSVGVNLYQHADETRISVLQLEEPSDRDGETKEQHFDRLTRTVSDVLTSDWCAGLRARAIKHLGTIRANAETFARVTARAIGNRRAGDQVGALLAGAYLLTSDKLISPESAQEWVDKQDWTEQKMIVEKSDERECLDWLLQHEIMIAPASRRQVQQLLLCSDSSGAWEDISREVADNALRLFGAKALIKDRSKYVAFSNQYRSIREALRNSAWEKCYHRVLLRLPGARESSSETFVSGTSRTRAVLIPWSEVFKDS